MSKCHAEGCNNEIFSHNFCRYHAYMRKRKGGDLYQKKPRKGQKNDSLTLSPKSDTKIPKQSKRRKIEQIRYEEQIKLFWEESVDNKTDYCFFCGVHMDKRDNIHHLRGRTNDYLLDKTWWVNAHQKCHTDNYHSANAEQRTKQAWWSMFLERIRLKSEDLYLKELKKIEKAGLLFED